MAFVALVVGVVAVATPALPFAFSFLFAWANGDTEEAHQEGAYVGRLIGIAVGIVAFSFVIAAMLGAT